VLGKVGNPAAAGQVIGLTLFGYPVRRLLREPVSPELITERFFSLQRPRQCFFARGDRLAN